MTLATDDDRRPVALPFRPRVVGEFPAADDPRNLTLRQAFERYLLPELQAHAAPGTIGEYCRALGHWERRVVDPPLHEIDDHHAQLLRDSMLRDPRRDYSAYTINKTWRHLRAILRRVGPRYDRNPQGAEIIARVPHLRKLRERPKLARVATFRELDALHEACRVAEWPKGGPPAPEQWRALLVLLFNTGPRTRDALELEWAGVHEACERWPHGAVAFVARKTSKVQAIPLHPVAAAHLDRIRDDRRRVFAFTRSNRDLYGTWREINEAAGLAEPLEFRDLRETCNVVHERVRPGSGRWMLGHAERGVNERFYTDPTEDVLQAVLDCPQPTAFERVLLRRDGPHQLCLF